MKRDTRTKTGQRAKPSGSLDLTAMFHTRISKRAEDLLRRQAQRRQMKASTYGRELIYMGLGILKP